MSKKVCIAQSVEELKFILKKVQQSVLCLPLNLETQLYCIQNNLHFYNPMNFIDNNFYKQALLESENLINNLNFGELKFDSHKKEYKVFIRFRFYSVAFLIELIEKINAHEKIDEIFISGWNNYAGQYSNKNYFVSYIILNLINDIRISKLSNYDMTQISTREEKKYFVCNTNLDKNKNYILISNIGYNFLRFVFLLNKKNYHFLVPVFEKVSFFKKIILKMYKLTFVKFNISSNKEHKNLLLPKIKFFYKKKDLSKILDFRKEQELGNLIKLKNQSEAIDSLFDKTNIKLVLTNITRGVYGYFMEKAKERNIPSVCIPHGTLSASFNKFDKIYKNIIAESISTNQSEFFAVQSKITRNFIESNNINSKAINTGNLIFCESKNTNKNKILFAVTLKDFESFQYLGVEMYYEFLDNLNLLNKIAKKNDLNFLVKPHPSIIKYSDDLKREFKNLEFTKQSIDKALKNVFVTISFSSTIIEDSLYSNIPVILLDRWKRYKHCKAEENTQKKNSAVYYVNNENDLIDCINTIRKSYNISFDDYIFSGNVKNNIHSLINKLL